MSITYYYDLPTVSCASCTAYIDSTLAASPLLKECVIGTDPLDKNLSITLEDESLGYLEVMDILNSMIGPAHECVPLDIAKQGLHPLWWKSHIFLGGFGTTLGFLLLSLCFFMTGPLSMIFQLIIGGMSTVLTLALGADFYKSAFYKLKKGQLTMDTLFSISTLVSLIASLGSFVFPALPMMFETGLLIFGFRHLGLAIHEKFKQNGLLQKRFQDEAPLTVLKKTKKGLSVVNLSLIKAGHLIELKAGDILPVDGFFETTDGLIVDDIVTGSNNPRPIIKGERLYAGTRLLQATKPLLFHVVADPSSSHLAVLDDKIARAKFEKSPLRKEVDKLLFYFIPLVLVFAMLSLIIVGYSMGLRSGLMCAISVLASACPCTLGLITPFSLLIGMRKAAKGGVSFNSATKLELTAQANCIVFDLNGTLTMGQPAVVRYNSLVRDLSDDQCLALLAYFEESSPHPIAQAIRKAAHQKITLPSGVVTLKNNHYTGLVLDYEGSNYVLGGEALMIEQGVLLPSPRIVLKPDETIVYLARNRVLIGYLVLEDKFRPQAKTMITALKNMGKEIHLCTGESRVTAERRALALGIDLKYVRSECLSHHNAPKDKSKKYYINQLKEQKKCVAMVGDAGNDAEAIAASDIGFALNLGSANTQTQQQAAAVIHSQSLMPLVHAFKTAQATIKNIKQNLWFSFIYNTIALLVSGGFLLRWDIVLNPAAGAAFMIVQVLFVLMNVSRFGLSNEDLPEKGSSKISTKGYTNVFSSLFGLSHAHEIQQGVISELSYPTISENTSSTGPTVPWWMEPKEFVQQRHQQTQPQQFLAQMP